MKLSQLELALLTLAVAGGVYYILKTKNTLGQFENAYNSLAGQISSGKLVMSQPSTTTIN